MAWRVATRFMRIMRIMRINWEIVASGCPIIIRSPGTILMEGGVQRTPFETGPPVKNVGGVVADMSPRSRRKDEKAIAATESRCGHALLPYPTASCAFAFESGQAGRQTACQHAAVHFVARPVNKPSASLKGSDVSSCSFIRNLYSRAVFLWRTPAVTWAVATFHPSVNLMTGRGYCTHSTEYGVIDGSLLKYVLRTCRVPIQRYMP